MHTLGIYSQLEPRQARTGRNANPVQSSDLPFTHVSSLTLLYARSFDFRSDSRLTRSESGGHLFLVSACDADSLVEVQFCQPGSADECDRQAGSHSI